MPRILKDKIVVEKLWGGIIPEIEGQRSAHGYEGKDDQYSISSGISFFRLGRLGHIAPGEVFSPITDGSDYIDEVVLNGEVASNGRAFFVQRDGKVIRTNVGGTSTTDGTDVAITGIHAGHTVQSSYNPDLVIIKDAANVPNEYVVFSWEDDVDADVGIMTPGFGSINWNWFSGLTGGGSLYADVPLKIVQAMDGNVYFTNGQYLASATMTRNVALTAATGNAAALNLGAGWTASGIAVYQEYIATIGYRATAYVSGVSHGLCRVWIWDGYSPDPNKIYDIQDNFAEGIFYDGANLFAITNGRNNSMKIWQLGDRGFVLKFESATEGTSSNPLQGGIEYYQNSLHFVSRTDKVYQLFGDGLHIRTRVTHDGETHSTAIGMLKNLYQSQLFIGMARGAGGAAPHEVYYSDQFTEYFINADFRSKLYVLPHRATLRRMRIYFSQFGSGASIRVSLFKDYGAYVIGGNADLLAAAEHTITNATHGALAHYEMPLNISDVNSFYFAIRFNHTAITDTAAIIRKIVFDYEYDVDV